PSEVLFRGASALGVSCLPELDSAYENMLCACLLQVNGHDVYSLDGSRWPALITLKFTNKSHSLIPCFSVALFQNAHPFFLQCDFVRIFGPPRDHCNMCCLFNLTRLKKIVNCWFVSAIVSFGPWHLRQSDNRNIFSFRQPPEALYDLADFLAGVTPRCADELQEINYEKPHSLLAFQQADAGTQFLQRHSRFAVCIIVNMQRP